MSLTQETARLNLPKDKPRRPSNQPARPSKAGTRQSGRVRLTVSLPVDLVDRVRDAVYWSPDLKLAWLIAQSLRASLADLEKSRQGPFPKRIMALRAGRPRLVGQSMKVPPRTRLNANGTARFAEGITQATLASQQPIE
jgi:hypothetical protein